METIKDESIPENIRCLANHKIKARILRNGMMRDRINRQDDNLGAKIIKYETFLSQNMIQKIKTEDIVQLQEQVQQYCINKKGIAPIKIQALEKGFNIHSMFEEIKRQVKERVKCKRRSKTSQSPDQKLVLLAKPTQLVRRQVNENQLLKNNETARGESIEKCQLRGKQKQIGLKGKIMTKNLINIIEKMEEMKYFSQKTGRKLGPIIDDRPSPQKLKEQNERLNTATQNNQRTKFTPIGKISQQNKRTYHSQEKLLVTHMPKIKRSTQQKDQARVSVNGQKKLTELRKSSIKFENERGIKFKEKRQLALNPITRLSTDPQHDQLSEINCF